MAKVSKSQSSTILTAAAIHSQQQLIKQGLGISSKDGRTTPLMDSTTAGDASVGPQQFMSSVQGSGTSNKLMSGAAVVINRTADNGEVAAPSDIEWNDWEFNRDDDGVSLQGALSAISETSSGSGKEPRQLEETSSSLYPSPTRRRTVGIEQQLAGGQTEEEAGTPALGASFLSLDSSYDSPVRRVRFAQGDERPLTMSGNIDNKALLRQKSILVLHNK